MKKQVTLAALSLMTLAGGSWLAAQQRDSVRTTSTGTALLTRASAGGEVTSEAAPDDEPTKARQRPSAAAAQRNDRPRVASDPQRARAAVELYREDVARFPGEARGFTAAGQELAGLPFVFSAGIPQRMSPEDAARMRAFQDAIKELRDAQDPDDKAAAREQVTQLVSEQLEVDLENREKELVAIETRAKELRKQLDERKTAKPELLKMLVMLIDNPQVGLGIPPEWMQMLMRSQPERYRPGAINIQGGDALYSPAAPSQPPMPPAAFAPVRDDLEATQAEDIGVEDAARDRSSLSPRY